MKQSKNLTTSVYGNTVRDAIRTTYNAVALPRLTVDWNWNRYVTPTADNIPAEIDEGFDVEAFPIESIIEPVRPSTKGIVKARVNEAKVSDQYQKWNTSKFYVGDAEDEYKYWTSPYATNGSGVFPLHTDTETTARPYVLYPTPVSTNKIIIRLENTWAQPLSYDVRTKATVGGAWGSTVTNPAINAATGIITLYWTGSAWSTSKPAVTVYTPVAGIMLRVNSMTGGKERDGSNTTYLKVTYDLGSMSTWGSSSTVTTNGANASLNVIAIEAHYEADLTERLISTNDDFEMSAESQLYPIGTITSNQAEVTLSNDDGLFNEDNVSSPYYRLLDANAEFNLEYIYTLNGVQHSVQQFKMYSVGPWASDEGTVTVSLEDSSNWLKSTKLPPTMYEEKNVTEIVWRILDAVGFTNYEIDEPDVVIQQDIPVWWTDGEKTIWEIFNELAEGTQTAIYFDENNVLQVKTREAAYDEVASPVWTMYGQTVGANIEDIEQQGLSFDKEFEANKIEVKYKTTKWALNSIGKPALAKVWEPDTDALVVRSSALKQTLGTSDPYLHIDQSEVSVWPYESKVNIDGEIIQYKGKRYLYHTGASGNVKHYVTVMDQGELDTYNKKTDPAYRHQNQLTGGLAITERGVWNSEVQSHSVDINNWNTAREVISGGSGVYFSGSRGFSQDRSRSVATINTVNDMKDANDTFWALRGSTGSTAYKATGVRMSFVGDPSSSTQRGGFGFCINGAGNDGYYVELALTSEFDGKKRESRAEVMIYSRVGTDWKVVAKGNEVLVAKDRWYEVDAYMTGSSQHTITVWINGRKLAEGTTTAPTKQPEGGKVTMYARGKSHIDYEYFYGIARSVVAPVDEFGFYDLKYGGMRGALFQKEHVWTKLSRWQKIKKKPSNKEKNKRNQYLFDEFGPYMHEVREFDVKFSQAPVKYSYLFSTNEWYATTVEYAGTPFSAKFIVANIGRDNAILSGDDSIIFGGPSRAVRQVCAVLGQYLDISEEESVTIEDEVSIRRHGIIESELSSDWIQTKGMAEAIGEWMKSHWGTGADQIEVNTYGNPLLQLGDVVTIDYDFYHMSPATHKYFVVATRSEFDADNGLKTTFTLRRAIN